MKEKILDQLKTAFEKEDYQELDRIAHIIASYAKNISEVRRRLGDILPTEDPLMELIEGYKYVPKSE